MHEVGVAECLIGQAVAAAGAHGLRRVACIGVSVGTHCGVVPHALGFAFSVLRGGTVLADARLEIMAAAGDALRLEWIEGE
ncbi:MAG: hydrogenase maturation nickel metallochaperone HypA [Armatimonadota bacterium]|nr:hydrogenase maturation nickel metallochaperone HypA [Armatimonadota bacterium]MDR7422284.1 hydrogenase maturation nickel metallochaperone HypA [Armatimonadota bacterium]MDR7453764.1 hydrogenase maturation nickel metallochaperone HypA [Armatimonadota bacterium]MDR7456293.1 hydrogenase maturation nickel metallochaperone HypA [Armatimonadota bacterium]MDR7496290.1 hydrogenase maturation nickel metallochaperone HypA [Armatimonadota bacterium]